MKDFNQDLLICRKTETDLVLKLDIDFISLWDDPMQDGSVTIINIFELFEQTALINPDKNCAEGDDYVGWERRKDAFFVTWLDWDKYSCEQSNVILEQFLFENDKRPFED